MDARPEEQASRQDNQGQTSVGAVLKTPPANLVLAETLLVALCKRRGSRKGSRKGSRRGKTRVRTRGRRGKQRSRRNSIAPGVRLVDHPLRPHYPLGVLQNLQSLRAYNFSFIRFSIVNFQMVSVKL